MKWHGVHEVLVLVRNGWHSRAIVYEAMLQWILMIYLCNYPFMITFVPHSHTTHSHLSSLLIPLSLSLTPHTQAAAGAEQGAGGGVERAHEVLHMLHARRVLRDHPLRPHHLRAVRGHVARRRLPHLPHSHAVESALLSARSCFPVSSKWNVIFSCKWEIHF